MIVAKLLTVKVQPVFVFVDTDTADVLPAPPVTPADLPAAQLGQLAELIERARQSMQAQASEGGRVLADTPDGEGENPGPRHH